MRACLKIFKACLDLQLRAAEEKLASPLVSTVRLLHIPTFPSQLTLVARCTSDSTSPPVSGLSVQYIMILLTLRFSAQALK